MLRLQHPSLMTSLSSLGLNIVLALLCISSFTTASPVQPSKDVLLAERAPIPGSVNSGPLLAPGAPAAPGPPRMPTIPSANVRRLDSLYMTSTDKRLVEYRNGAGRGTEPICDGLAPTERSLYPSGPLADRFIGGSLEAVCRERDPGPNCVCLLKPRTLQVDLQCFMVGNFFPTLDRDWQVSGVIQTSKTKCHCPHIPDEQIPPGSPRSPSLGPRPSSLGQRPQRGPSLDVDSVVQGEVGKCLHDGIGLRRGVGSRFEAGK